MKASIDLAAYAAQRLDALPDVSLVHQPQLGVVLFRRTGWGSQQWATWARKLLADGVAFVAPTNWKGEPVGRLVFLHPQTSLAVVDEVLATLADLYLAQGKTKEALAMLDTADKNDNSVKFVLAKARIANNEPSQARPFLDQLINQDNQNAEYYFQRGLCWYQERNWSNAQDDFASSLKYNADQMDAVYYTGVSLLKQGKSEEAQNSFKELSQNANKSIAAKGLYGMAMAFDADRKLEAVENYANKSIAAKENPEALTLLGRTYLRQRKAPQAEKPLKRALELSPRDPSVIAAVSEMEMAQGRKTDAVGRITKALQDFPNSCDVQLGAAKINFLAGNFDKSWEGGLQAIGNCPDDPGGYFFLGLTSDHKGNKKEAKRFFGEFVKHGGDSANVPEEYR